MPEKAASSQKQFAVRRFAARTLDIAVFGLPLYYLLPSDWSLTIVLMLELASYVFIEAVIVWKFGNTFGKFIFGLQIKRTDDQKLSFRDAFMRSRLVWFYGEACGIWLLPVVSLSYSYNRLLEKGDTIWDEKCETEVVMLETRSTFSKH